MIIEDYVNVHEVNTNNLNDIQKSEGSNQQENKRNRERDRRLDHGGGSMLVRWRIQYIHHNNELPIFSVAQDNFQLQVILFNCRVSHPGIQQFSYKQQNIVPDFIIRKQNFKVIVHYFEAYIYKKALEKIIWRHHLYLSNSIKDNKTGNARLYSKWKPNYSSGQVFVTAKLPNQGTSGTIYLCLQRFVSVVEPANEIGI